MIDWWYGRRACPVLTTIVNQPNLYYGLLILDDETTASAEDVEHLGEAFGLLFVVRIIREASRVVLGEMQFIDR